MLTHVYLVRHCDVQNPDGILYGHLPGFGLSEQGVRQAHALGRYFATTNVRQIYSSPLERAQQTAHVIASYLDGVPVTVTPELIEARFGRYLQGVKPRDVLWRRPLWLVHMVRPGLLERDETVEEMAARLSEPINRLLREHPGSGGICVSHGDPIQAYWVKADRRPAFALHRLQCAKGGMLDLEYDDSRLVGKAYRPPPVTDGSSDDSSADSPAIDASHA